MTKADAKGLTLAETQSMLQRAILDGDDAILDTILDNSRTSRTTLFGVYRNAYVGRLVDVLHSDYEVLRTYVGDDYFDNFARAYIAAHPSRDQNVRWFGARLPEFLAAADSNADHPLLAEIAAIERATSQAFDAADAPVLAFEDLAQHPPETWMRLTFAPHPSAQRIDCTANAFDIWKASKNGETPDAAKALPQPQHLIIWRQSAAPMVRVLGAEETMMWTEMSRGVRFEGLCELVATFDDPDTAAARAAQYLQGWLTSQLLMSAKLAEPRKARKAAKPIDRPAARKAPATARGGA